jgi:hypothetical protein
MKIYIWDNGGITMDRYIVLIGQHCYYMSIYPDRANEVNMYAGTLKSNIHAINKTMANLKFKNVQMPKSLKCAIRLRCKEIRHETKK